MNSECSFRSITIRKTKLKEETSSGKLKLQFVFSYKVISHIYITEKGSRPQKRFQERTSHCRAQERQKQFYIHGAGRGHSLKDTAQISYSLQALRRAGKSDQGAKRAILGVKQSIEVQKCAIVLYIWDSQKRLLRLLID